MLLIQALSTTFFFLIAVLIQCDLGIFTFIKNITELSDLQQTVF